MNHSAIQNLINELKQFAKFPMVDQPTIEAAIDFAQLRIEMEKEQIIDAFQSGYDAGWCMAKESSDDDDMIYNADQYYNQYFIGNENK